MKTYQGILVAALTAMSLAACSSTGMKAGDSATGGSATGTATATGSAAAKGNSDANGTGKPAGGTSASGSSGAQGSTGAVIDDVSGAPRPATGTNGQ